MRSEHRCYCGEPFFEEYPFLELGDPVFLRFADLAEIRACEGCGRDLADVVEELADQWYEQVESRYGDAPDRVRCGGGVFVEAKP